VALPLTDLTGQKFSRLTVIKAVKCADRTRWLCQCECGNTRIVSGSDLRKGNPKSCGCWKREQQTTHAECSRNSISPEYYSWRQMKSRCFNPNATGYKYYGGRGIRVCERWLNYEAFLSDMGRRPTPKHTLDRIDTDGNYEPANCRWATRAEQVRNRKPYDTIASTRAMLAARKRNLALGGRNGRRPTD
jgi:hypothetical protein